MSFAAKPLVAGDLFEASARLSTEIDQEVARLAEPAERIAVLRRRWDEIVALGWPATVVPEEFGGAGGGLLDLAAIVEGAGRAALPLPLAGVCGAVPALLGAAAVADTAEGGVALARDALTGMAEGRLRICPVLALAAHGGAGGRADREGRPPLAARPGSGDDGAVAALLLDGAVLGVEAPPEPTHYLLACPVHPVAGREQSAVLVLLPADAPGLAARWHERIDGRPAVDLDLRSVPVSVGQVLARGEAVRERAAAVSDAGALLVCVEAVSAMGALLEQTIAYLSTRVQFGVPLASFQALRHRVADMYVAYRSLRALVGRTLRRATEDGATAPPWREVALAKLRLGGVGRFVAEAAIQLHGGMGMTQELAAARLAKRILMAEFEYGDTDHQARRLLAAAR